MIAGEGLVGAPIAFLIGSSGKFPALGSALTSMHFAAKDFTHLTGAAANAVCIVDRARHLRTAVSRGTLGAGWKT